MPTIYQNPGHRKRLVKEYRWTQWKWYEWRKDPHCRTCLKYMHMDTSHGWKNQATLDHRLSRGMGGSDEPDNWDLICGKCNNNKSKLENIEFKKPLTFEE